MDELSCIYWFSGTGNSLYAAKRLSSELGGMKLMRITDEPPSGAVGGKGAKVGFVFPSYYGNLPRAVRAFVEKLEIKPDTYIFTLVTMGGAGQGSVAMMSRALKEKGLKLNYGIGLHMPANYVLMYNPADPAKVSKALDTADRRLRKFASEINAGVKAVRPLPIISNTLYKDIATLDAGFTYGGGCTGCGLCEKICPAGNIRLEDGRPVWQHHCERCVACISWCPAKAIDYGNKTQARRRYQNPRVSVDEMTR